MLMKTTGKMSGHGSGKAINGRWTREEHELFLKALNEYGREWKKVAKKIKTRSSAQIRSHAQKYFQKLSKESKAGLHGGAAALHGSHVVLDKSNKKKASNTGDKTLIKKKRKMKGKSLNAAYSKKQKQRPVSPNFVSKPVNTYGGGRFSPVQKTRASPKVMDASLSLHSAYGDATAIISSPSRTSTSSFTSPFVTRNFVQTIATKKKLVQSWEQKLRTLLSKRKKVSGFTKGANLGMTANTTINVFPTSTTGVAPHDDLVVTPRLSPLNIPENEREVSRIRERLNRRDELIKVDKKIIDVIDSACTAPCICGEPKLIFHCRNQQEKEVGNGNSYICLTVRQKMLNIFQRSYEKNGQYSTPQSTILLQNWKRINLEVANAKAAELSYQNAEMLYMALSPIARENLSILDNEELSAVQVLIGSMMGIRPRKTKGGKKKTQQLSITTTTTTKTTINYDDDEEEDDASESESDEEEESSSEEEDTDDDDDSESESDDSDDDSESDEEE